MTTGGIVWFIRFCWAACGDAGKVAKSSKSSLPVLGIGVGRVVLNLDSGTLPGMGAGAGGDGVVTVSGTTLGGTILGLGAAVGCGDGTTFGGFGLCGGETGFLGIGLKTDGL